MVEIFGIKNVVTVHAGYAFSGQKQPIQKEFAEVMQEALVHKNQDKQENSSPIKVGAVQEEASLKSVLRTFSQNEAGLSAVMQAALSQEELSPKQLVILQAATYQVTFEMSALAKLAETSTNAVKTTMQTQV